LISYDRHKSRILFYKNSSHAAFGMFGLSALGQQFDFLTSHHWATALVAAVVGWAITILAATKLHTARATLRPMRPQNTSAFVTTP
jgi:branched-subunit amino acid ABC-type transport system permease component